MEINISKILIKEHILNYNGNNQCKAGKILKIICTYMIVIRMRINSDSF